MNGTFAFWTRIALIAISGGFVSHSGVQIFDPDTGMISLHVDDLQNLFAAGAAMLGWKGMHSEAKAKNGKT